MGDVNGTPAKDGVCTVSWQKDTQKVLFSFEGSRIAFPENDRDGFANSYAQLVSKYLTSEVISKSTFDSRKQAYNGHYIVSVSSKDNNFINTIISQATEEEYPDAVINGLKQQTINTAFFDENQNLLAYYYSDYDKNSTSLYPPEYGYLKDAKGNLIASGAVNTIKDNYYSKTAIANYYWDENGKPKSQ